MNIDQWKSCPLCRTTLAHADEASGGVTSVSCPSCGFTKYDNPLPSTIGLVVRDRRLLLVRRAHEPMRGKWDTVGGFLSGSETAEDCLRREALEEIGCEISALDPIGTFSSIYGETGLRTIGIAFTCTVGTNDVIELSDENSEYGWFGVGEIPADVAFADVRAAISVFVKHQTNEAASR